jgi:16S rRNA (cytosine967-C5)-methyltransferase
MHMQDAGRTRQRKAFSNGVDPVAPTDKPREKAIEILRGVENGGFADTLIDRARPVFGDRDNAFILELVYGTLRNQALLDWILNQFSLQPVAKTDAWTRNILRLCAYQMFLLDKVPVSAAVNTATELAKVYGKKSSYVNGLLRTLDRKRNEIVYPGVEDPIKRLSVLYSHPVWLVRRWVARFGEDVVETLLRGNNVRAPLVIRTNPLKTTRDGLKASLLSQGVDARETVYSPVGLELISSPPLRTLAAYEQGWFMVQDQAAQLVSLLLRPQPGETVLDACAAPGGKATHLAELMRDQGTLIALESDRERLKKIRENCARLGLTIVIPTLRDASRYQEGRFDKILIDAPCSGLGVLRRHPDGRWSKTEEAIQERRALQTRILTNCAKLLKPGGALVYATCTTEPEENADVIEELLLKAGGEFAIDDPRSYLPEQAACLVDERGFFHTYPRALEMDGFFGARLTRKK